MNVRFVTAAETALLDQRTNVLSLVGIVEEVLSPAFPVFMPRIAIVALLEKEQGDPDVIEGGSVAVTLGEQTLLATPVQINFQGRARTRNIVDISGFLIP